MFFRSGGSLAAMIKCQSRAAARSSSRFGSASADATLARSRRSVVVSS
jgi:hypothetical protein